jgi:anti-anti-sigma factor
MARTNRIRKRPDDPPLDIRIVADGEGVCRVECTGALDIRSVALFDEGLCAALRQGVRHLVLDLREVTRMDSVAVGRVVGLSRRIAPGARLQVLLSDRRLGVLLQIAGVGRFVSEGIGQYAAKPRPR